MLRPIHAVIDVRYPEPDEIDTLYWVSGTLSEGVSYVAVAGGTIVGAMGFEVQGFPWNHAAQFLNCQWFDVAADYRKSTVAARFVKIAKELGNQMKMPVVMGMMTGTDAELKDRFMAVKGFKYCGGMFMYQEDSHG